MFTRLIVLNILKYLPSCAQTVHSHSHFWEQFDLRKEQEQDRETVGERTHCNIQTTIIVLSCFLSLSGMCMCVYVSVRVLYAMLSTGAGAAGCMQVNFFSVVVAATAATEAQPDGCAAVAAAVDD